MLDHELVYGSQEGRPENFRVVIEAGFIPEPDKDGSVFTNVYVSAHADLAMLRFLQEEIIAAIDDVEARQISKAS
ncbi:MULTISPECIES: hypothetical protein [Erysipelotrichaceae]|uniref:hypothetical protein n=1 Tax=Erysipelotrichaceae TaxID=128827 RepID=UPI00259B0D1F|nr:MULTISPECIES: hypothetical protein [Erysipelotrichaceae]